MKTFVSAVFLLALILSSPANLAGEIRPQIATAEFTPYYGKDVEGGGYSSEFVVEAINRARMSAQYPDSLEPGSITVTHWVIVNRNKPAQEVVLDEPPTGFEGYNHGAIYEERGPRTFYCSHSLDPCRAWSDYGKSDTPPSKR